GTPFNPDHQVNYGLSIASQDAATSEVVSVNCLFCIHFGREDTDTSTAQEERKRRRTENIKSFTRPFRTDNYVQHFSRQHKARWDPFKILARNQKATFFQRNAPVRHRNTIPSHFVGNQTAMQLYINKAIVDIIIGDILLDQDDDDGLPNMCRERALRIFKDIDPNTVEDPGLATTKYQIDISNPKQFNLVAGFLSTGVSFRQAEALVTMTKEVTGVAEIGTAKDERVAQYARFILALNLQHIHNILDNSWAFSIALDMSTHMSTSYLDICIRLFWHGDILNLHLIGILVFCRHTAAEVYRHASAVLDVLCTEWKTMVISISTDGEPRMIGHIGGCGLHQLDLKLRSFYEELMDEQFVSMLTALIGYLHRQQNLINDMATKCCTLAETRWESMSKVASWFKTHRVAIREYLEAKNPSYKSPHEWWVVLMFVEDVSAAAAATFKQLQKDDTLVSRQHEAIANLRTCYKDYIKANGPLASGQREDIDIERDVVSSNDMYSARVADMTTFLEDMGGFVSDRMQHAGQASMENLARNLSKGLLNLIAGLDELVTLNGRDFTAIVRAQHERLAARWASISAEATMDYIETKFRDLKNAYRNEEPFRNALDGCTYQMPFSKAWKLTSGQFKKLEMFCGGLASTFPGTSSVERDFCILKWEKDIHRMSLTDFSLEGVMHARQFKLLQKLTF
ncbi:hypothetical protein MARPO_0033s0135, partial [Marchantia polymorpha]